MVGMVNVKLQGSENFQNTVIGTFCGSFNYIEMVILQIETQTDEIGKQSDCDQFWIITWLINNTTK